MIAAMNLLAFGIVTHQEQDRATPIEHTSGRSVSDVIGPRP
jgi:hypothetical protein